MKKKLLLTLLAPFPFIASMERLDFSKNTKLDSQLFKVMNEDAAAEKVLNLIEQGADINVLHSELGFDNIHIKAATPPLIYATKSYFSEVCKVLIENKANVNVTGHNREMTPLILAILNDLTEVSDLLIKNGANVNYKVERKNGNNISGWTALHFAASRGRFEICTQLLKNGAKPKARTNCSAYRYTPLSLAALNGHIKVVTLLAQYANNNEINAALHFAAKNGKLAVCKFLLEEGAKVNTKDSLGYTPLLWATTNGHWATCKHLIEKEAPVETMTNTDDTPLMRAATKGHTAIVELLIDNGAEINAYNGNDDTPLMLAARYEHPEVCILLIKKGAIVTVKNNDDHTPLFYLDELPEVKDLINKLLTQECGICYEKPNKFAPCCPQAICDTCWNECKPKEKGCPFCRRILKIGLAPTI